MEHSATQHPIIGRNDDGFTLVEVLLAIVMLTVALLGVAALTGGIIRGNTHSNQVTTASTLAQDQMEDLRRKGYSGIAASDTTTIEDYNSVTGFAGYKRVTAIDVASPNANTKTIIVTVYWDSDSKSVELKTVLAQGS